MRAQVIAGSLVAATIAVAMWFYVGPCRAPATTVLLVRHADREPGQDRLSAGGLERAQTLARVLSDAGVTSIYTTQYVRTQETAAPVASTLKLRPVEVDAGDSEAVARDIRRNHRGQTVLVVGHSNTVPAVVAALGGPSIPDFAEDEFSKLLVLDVCGCFAGQARLTELRY